MNLRRQLLVRSVAAAVCGLGIASCKKKASLPADAGARAPDARLQPAALDCRALLEPESVGRACGASDAKTLQASPALGLPAGCFYQVDLIGGTGNRVGLMDITVRRRGPDAAKLARLIKLPQKENAVPGVGESAFLRHPDGGVPSLHFAEGEWVGDITLLGPGCDGTQGLAAAARLALSRLSKPPVPPASWPW